MKLTLETTIKEIISDEKIKETLNNLTQGLFNNPSIIQADSMSLKRIAVFIHDENFEKMNFILSKANEILKDYEGISLEDTLLKEVNNAVSLSDIEEKTIIKYNSIKPGSIIRDNNGRRIQAHGGTMYIENNTYYWIGENKDYTREEGNIWTWGVKIYSSNDLYNWTDLGYLLKPDLKNPTSTLFPTKRLDRPHLVYNKKTKKYVLWIKFLDDMFFNVYESDFLLGEYKAVHEIYHPFGFKCGDFDLALDEENNECYLYFEAEHNKLIGTKLDKSFTCVENDYKIIFDNMTPPYTREGIAHVIYNKKHYIFSSGMTGYIPNPSEVAVSDSFLGEYKVLGNPHVFDESCSSYNSQISNIFKVIDKDIYIAMADRWVPNTVITKEKYDLIERVIKSRNDSKIVVTKEEVDEFSKLPMMSTANTSIATYVWLKIDFTKDIPTINYLDEYKI